MSACSTPGDAPWQRFEWCNTSSNTASACVTKGVTEKEPASLFQQLCSLFGNVNGFHKKVVKGGAFDKFFTSPTFNAISLDLQDNFRKQALSSAVQHYRKSSAYAALPPEEAFAFNSNLRDLVSRLNKRAERNRSTPQSICCLAGIEPQNKGTTRLFHRPGQQGVLQQKWERGHYEASRESANVKDVDKTALAKGVNSSRQCTYCRIEYKSVTFVRKQFCSVGRRGESRAGKSGDLTPSFCGIQGDTNVISIIEKRRRDEGIQEECPHKCPRLARSEVTSTRAGSSKHANWEAETTALGAVYTDDACSFARAHALNCSEDATVPHEVTAQTLPAFPLDSWFGVSIKGETTLNEETAGRISPRTRAHSLDCNDISERMPQTGAAQTPLALPVDAATQTTDDGEQRIPQQTSSSRECAPCELSLPSFMREASMDLPTCGVFSSIELVMLLFYAHEFFCEPSPYSVMRKKIWKHRGRTTLRRKLYKTLWKYDKTVHQRKS